MNKIGVPSKKMLFGLLGGAVVIVLTIFLSQSSLISPLVVTKTAPPQQGSLNPFAPITIEFNRAPRTNEYEISIDPKTDFSIISSSPTSIQIRPKTNLVESANYTVTIKTKPVYVLFFTTEQAASNVPGWNDLFDRALDQAEQINGAQDRALAEIRKGVPIEQPGFLIDYAYSTNTFTVSFSAPHEQNKALFLAWIKGRGVSDLSVVTIKYVNQ